MEKSSPSEADRRIIIGKVGAPLGVKGEVKIIPMSDFPDRFDGMTR
ncbi:MAG: 16S rRNA processing protein RimM, partial [Schwartzia sp.]|nr:16S rRNA processing protein RimM [Schwartzia sp. (in: firmicutes)]